jgi:serine O-acetyltransferase
MRKRIIARSVRQLRELQKRVYEDIDAFVDNDPAARDRFDAVVFAPGLHALWMHRVAHRLWRNRRRRAARAVAHVSRFLTGVEIHPAAVIGRRVVIDHGMGVVIGETATVGDGCLLYKGVVLGARTRERIQRHPQLGEGVVVGSNACILGNITIGSHARIGSCSVVLRSIPPSVTAVGVPARVLNDPTDVPSSPAAPPLAKAS